MYMISKQDLFNCITIGFTTCLVINYYNLYIFIYEINNRRFNHAIKKSSSTVFYC